MTNQAQFQAAIAVASQPGHNDTIDATGASLPIDAGPSLTLPATATSVNVEFSNLAIGAPGTGDETVTLGAGATLNFEQVGPSTLNMGSGNTGTLNINGGSVIFNVTTQGSQFNIGLDGGNGVVNMTSGAVTVNDSAATPGVFGSISVGYPFGAGPANATFNQSGGVVSVSAGALNVGVANGVGTYNLSGAAVLEDRGATVYIGASTGGVGDVNISGDATLDFESISAGANGQLFVGDNLGVGTITQNGANSTVILNVANIAQFGSNASAAPGGGGTGVYNLLAGTLEIGGLGAAFGMDAGGVGIFNQSGGNLTANAPIYIGMSGNGTYNLSGGSATLNAGLTIAALAGSIGTVNQTGGVLTIAGGQLKVGVAGVATYNLNGGVLQVGGANGVIGTGALNFGGGELQVLGSALTTNKAIGLTAASNSTVDTNGLGATLSGVLSGGGALTKAGAGTLVLSGVNAYTGGTTIAGGLVQAINSSSVGAGVVTLDGGGFQAGANGLAFGNAFTLDAGAANTIDTQAFSLSLSGPVSGAGGFAKQGSGVLTLSGATAYSGPTNINAGTLQGGATNAFAPLSAFTVAAGATLNLGGFNQAIGSLSGAGGVTLGAATLTAGGDGSNTTFSGGVSGAGGLTKTGAGTLTLSGANTYGGVTNVSAGTLQGGATNAFAPSSAFAISAGATLDLNGFNQTIGSLSGGGAVTLGTATLTAGGDGTSTTFSGAVSGAGGFAKQGAGVLTLSGSSSYGGPTNINAGTLQGGATNGFAPLSAFTIASGATLDLGGFNQAIGSLAGAGAVINSGAGLAVLSAGGDNASTAFSGVIRDDGPTGLTKTGSGTLTLSGTNLYTGPTNVEGGVLDVEGSIASSSLTTVSAGATLTGGGAVGATRIGSGGVFAPGSGTPGSSGTVFGALAFNPGATYLVAINPTTASLAKVQGAASLAGDVLAEFSPGSYLTRKYTILTTTGGLGGTTFAALIKAGAPAGFAEALTYDSDNVYLGLTAALGAEPGLNINQRNVATALDAAFNGGASLPSSFVNLYGSTGAALGAALAQITGEAATGARQGDFLFTDMFLSLLVDPYADSQAGEPGRAGSLGAAAGCGVADAGRPPAKGPQGQPCAPRWNVWAAGFGGGEQTSGDAAIGSHHAQIGAGGVAAGADYRVSPGAMLGFALAGGTTNWSLSGALGGGDGNVFQGAIYGADQFGPAYLAGALTLGNTWLTSDRTVELLGGGRYRSSFNATEFGGRIEGGYHVVPPPATLTPYAAVQPQTFHAPSYAESSSAFGPSFALNYRSQNATDTRFELGAWVDKSLVSPGDGVVKLFGRLAWAHDWQSDPSVTATFQSVPTASFAVNGARPAPNQALITAAVEWRLGQSWSLMAKFEDEIGSGSETYAATGRVNYTW